MGSVSQNEVLVPRHKGKCKVSEVSWSSTQHPRDLTRAAKFVSLKKYSIQSPEITVTWKWAHSSTVLDLLKHMGGGGKAGRAAEAVLLIGFPTFTLEAELWQLQMCLPSPGDSSWTHTARHPCTGGAPSNSHGCSPPPDSSMNPSYKSSCTPSWFVPV